MKFILVFLGAGLGGSLRYWISENIYKYLPLYFPWGTLIVNIFGSFLLGALIFWFDDKELLSVNMKLLLAVGFCGGFTTFSTFSYETFHLIRDTEFLLATANVLVNLLLSLGAVYLAYLISR
jgi:CrcB protein